MKPGTNFLHIKRREVLLYLLIQLDKLVMEDDLIRLAQQGNHEAFRQLVEFYHRLVERLARVLLNDRTMAEDAVQEAWLDVWQGLPGFEPGRPLRPWLLKVVANRCRMAARKRQLPAVSLDEELVSKVGDPAEQILRADQDAQLFAALNSLSADQRQIVALRFYTELELQEIANLTAIPLGTVKSRLHRGLASLRQKLQAPISPKAGG